MEKQNKYRHNEFHLTNENRIRGMSETNSMKINKTCIAYAISFFLTNKRHHGRKWRKVWGYL